MDLGLVCISEKLKPAVKFQTITRKRFNDIGQDLAVLGDRILNNIKTTEKIIVFCSRNNISHYRISSSLFPLITDPTLNLDITKLPNWAAISAALPRIGEASRKHNVSVSLHPDQFVVLGSLNDNSRDKSINELNFMCDMLDRMGLAADHSVPVNIHVNSSVPCLDQLCDIITDSLSRCTASVVNRLTFENEDKGQFNCTRLHDLYVKLSQRGHSIPLCYDNLHDWCNPNDSDTKSNIELFKSTWGNYKPVMHLSEGGKDGKIRAHVDYFSDKITDILPLYEGCVAECEVKAKDHAIEKLLQCC